MIKVRGANVDIVFGKGAFNLDQHLRNRGIERTLEETGKFYAGEELDLDDEFDDEDDLDDFWLDEDEF